MSTQSMASGAFWRSYLVTARPYLFFVSGAAGLVGLALRPQLSWGAFAAAFAMLFVAYGLGQALTDVSQTDTDALSAPYRPLVQGLISPRQVRTVSLAGFGLCGVGLLLLNPWTLVLAAIGVAGLATYTWFKRRWWAGPLYNSWIVALLPAIGFLCGSSGLGEAVASYQLLAAMVSVLFSYAVFVVLGYLKDISADRATGYETLPVRFGWRTSVAVSALFALLSLVASFTLVRSSLVPVGTLTPSTIIAQLAWLAGAACLAKAHVALLRISDESAAHGGIAYSVRAFVLLHLGEAALLLPALSLPAVGLYALFELGLVVRPERSQI